jgi:hypothetical protein
MPMRMITLTPQPSGGAHLLTERRCPSPDELSETIGATPKEIGRWWTPEGKEAVAFAGGTGERNCAATLLIKRATGHTPQPKGRVVILIGCNL